MAFYTKTMLFVHIFEFYAIQTFNKVNFWAM